MQENTQDMISQEEIDALLSPMTAEEWMDWMAKEQENKLHPTLDDTKATLTQEEITPMLTGEMTEDEWFKWMAERHKDED